MLVLLHLAHLTQHDVARACPRCGLCWNFLLSFLRLSSAHRVGGVPLVYPSPSADTGLCLPFGGCGCCREQVQSTLHFPGGQW